MTLMYVICFCFSKSGRPPLKKMSERKGVARLGHINAFGSPDFSGITSVPFTAY